MTPAERADLKRLAPEVDAKLTDIQRYGDRPTYASSLGALVLAALRASEERAAERRCAGLAMRASP
jgi:hypothetical protein